MKRLSLLMIFAGLLSACVTTHRTPAPIVDRTMGAEVTTAVPAGYYQAKKGDTLNSISRQYGQQLGDLVAWNHLNDPNDVAVGQVLRVQSPEVAHSAVSAETQTAQVISSGVEVRPLVTAPIGQPTEITHVTTPSGRKQPYSKKTWESMTASAGPAPIAATTPATVSRMIADTTILARMSEGVTWAWPADGDILATFHGKSKGVDIAGSMGQRVVAAADGKVIYSGAMRGYGNLVIVKHSDTLLSAYAHNKIILVKQRAVVTRGQKIAEMGNSDSDIVKLHFEVRRHGKPVDPARFLPKQR